MTNNRTAIEPPAPLIDEAERKSKQLLLELRQAVAGVNEPLELAGAEHLNQLTEQLLSVVAELDKLRNESATAKALIANWCAENSTDIQKARHLLSQPLAMIQSSVDENCISVSELNSLLETCSDLINHDKQESEINQQIQGAAVTGDSQRVISLSTELSTTIQQRDETLARMTSELNQGSQTAVANQSDTTEYTRESDNVTHGDSERDGNEEVGPSRLPTPQEDDKHTERGAAQSVQQPPTTKTPEASDELSSSDAKCDATDELPYSPQSLQHYPIIIVQALAHKRFGIAYYLSHHTSVTLLKPDAMRFITMNYATDEIGSFIAEYSRIAGALHDHVREALKSNNFDSTERSLALVLATAAFRPAILAPGGPVAQLLTCLKPLVSHMPHLQSLTSDVADISLKGVEIPVEFLTKKETTEHWNNRKTALRNKAETWIRAEKQSRLIFGPATSVWRRLLDTDSTPDRVSIGWMFEQIKTGDSTMDSLDRIRTASDTLRQHTNKEIDRIDRLIRPLSTTRKIDGTARVQLKRKIEEALALVFEWCTLNASQPTKTIGIQVELMNRLRKSVQEHGIHAANEISKVDSPLANCATDLMHRYLRLFDNEQSNTRSAPSISLELLLHGDLLVEPEVKFGKDLAPMEIPSESVLSDIASKDPVNGFSEAARDRAKRGDFHGSTLALDFAEKREYMSDISADKIRIEIESTRGIIEQQVIDNIRRTSDRLDATYALGALAEAEVEKLRRGVLSSNMSTLSQVENFDLLIEELHKIQGRIDTAKLDHSRLMRKRLSGLKRITDVDRSRIDGLIARERFLIADDYIDRIKVGQELPSEKDGSESLFDIFFPRFLVEYSLLSGQTADMHALILGAIEQRRVTPPIDARRLSSDSAEHAATLVKAWFRLRHSSESPIQPLSSLMTALGFLNVNVQRSKYKSLSGQPLFELNSATIANREVSPLPDFGSRAEGRYRLLLVRDKHTAEAVIQEIGPWTGDGEPPVIVIFTNFLDVEQRTQLSYSFHSGELHPTLVLDEALLMFVAFQETDRLRACFNCSTPFSFSQPFDPDATEVPAEMFFGRKAARKAILSTDGDCTHLVYGGRRLGKTALLADIAREFRGNTKSVLVLLINLRGSGIGENKQTSEIWRLIAEELSLHRVVGHGTVRFKAISEGVKKWLENSSGRRILLLVDEADAFLDAERLGFGEGQQKYRVLDEIKRLMEDTRRQFKVVFAGLHNVQRTARDPNTPLAHLGVPVQIGPMLPESDGSEVEQLRHLIRKPLEALGYRFTSLDSVTRIAAETNYYPALVQQFCKHLLADLRRNSDAAVDGPPYWISPEAVDRVFNARETRDRLRDLFSWTIELDPRYKFLTYLIAWHCLGSSDADAQMRSVSIDEIREDTLRECRQGFRSDDSYLTFEVLLEEMVGLGILREDHEAVQKSFVIRSRNLSRLLGQSDEIERRLIDAKGMAARARFDQVHFRNSLKVKRHGSSKTRKRQTVSKSDLISPFSAAQENMLLTYSNDVVFMFGTVLSGIDRVNDALNQISDRAKGGDLRVFVHNVTSGTVVGSLEEIKRRFAKLVGIHIHLVLIDCTSLDSLCSEQIAFALREVSSNSSRNRFIRPVFLGGPEFAWAWTNSGRSGGNSKALTREVWLGPCSLDFARIWLRERVERSYADLERADSTSDSLWPAVIETMTKQADISTIDDAVRHVVKREANDLARILQVGGLEQPLRLLASSPTESLTGEFLTDLLSDLEQSRDGITMSVDRIDKLMEWCHGLGIVRLDRSGYRIDGAWARGIEGSSV